MKPLLVSVASVLLSYSCASAQPAQNDIDDRANVLERVAEHLETDYVDAERVGEAAAAQLRADLDAGLFDQSRDGESFAESVGNRLRELTGDGHLNLEYSSADIGEGEDAQEAFNQEQMQRWYGAWINYGVESVERLDGNIGYLDLRVFPPIEMGGETIAAAMTVLADMDGLIIDLRHNGGGIGDTADLVASYLFTSERQPLTGVYDRPSDTLTQRFTYPFVPGRRFGPDKPVYVLISSETFSAAEALAYNLQALGRAEIIGEPSGGGAHPFEYLRIHPNYVLWSVTAKSVNPITGSNWQSVGVQPDIQVSSADALTR
ncbi:MAG: S41 family peptidase, partial [Pseudomonadota bacterium]